MINKLKIIGVFVGFSRIFSLGILIFKGLTVRRLYKSFGVRGLTDPPYQTSRPITAKRFRIIRVPELEPTIRVK
jgi:hypothetical protein